MTMSKILLVQKTLLIFLLMIIMKVQPTIAQTHKFEVGVEAGPNISFLNVHNLIIRSDIGFGFCSGVNFQFNINNIISLKTRICFNQIDYKLSGYEPHFIYTIKNYRLNYIKMPVLLKLGIPIKKINIFADLGPYIEYLLSEKTKISTESDPLTTKNELGNFHKIDAGLSLGIGTSLQIKKAFSISLEAGYDMGFLSTTNQNCNNRSGYLLLGCNYKFKEKKVIEQIDLSSSKRSKVDGDKLSLLNNFEMQVEVAPNISFANIISPTKEYTKTPLIGFLGGIAMQYNFNKYFAIKTGASFELKRYQISWTGQKLYSYFMGIQHFLDETYSQDIKFPYLTFPLLAKFSFNKRNPVFFFNAGPNFGILLSKYNNPLFDMGFIAGVGTSVKLNEKAAINIEPRFNMNLSDNEYKFYDSFQTSTISLIIGFCYKFGEKKAK